MLEKAMPVFLTAPWTPSLGAFSHGRISPVSLSPSCAKAQREKDGRGNPHTWGTLIGNLVDWCQTLT
jgi:hypothetical protein